MRREKSLVPVPEIATSLVILPKFLPVRRSLSLRARGMDLLSCEILYLALDRLPISALDTISPS